MTSSDAPMSAAMAIQSVAAPATASAMKSAFTPSAKTMFCIITRNVRREWAISQGSLARSSDISAMSDVSIAASVPAAPWRLKRWLAPWRARR